MKFINVLLLIILLASCKYKEKVFFKNSCECAPDSIKQQMREFFIDCMYGKTERGNISVSGNKIKRNSFGGGNMWECKEFAKELYCPKQKHIEIWKGDSRIVDELNADCNEELYYNLKNKYKR